MLNIIKAYAVNNSCYISAKKMVPKGIVVHSTGANNPYLKRYVDAPDEVGVNQYGNHWNTAKPGGRKVCVHAFIGYDKNMQIRVAQILPYDICCWGVGSGKKGSYNYNPAYIQFEICEDDLTDKNYYQKAFAVAADYCAMLCRDYGISVSNIVGHCEAYRLGYGSNHSDPEKWMKKFGETMVDFRKQVSENLQANNADKKDKEETTIKNETIEKGDLVSIAYDATYYDGKNMTYWVKEQRWYVANEPVGDRVVIDKNEKGTTFICSPVHKKYLSIARKASQTDPGDCPYQVMITADCLNIRKGAGTNTEKVGTIRDKGIYTIVKEEIGVGATKWGKLKSGVGWISLDYVRKI